MTVFFTQGESGDILTASVISHNAIENNFLYEHLTREGIEREQEEQRRLRVLFETEIPFLQHWKEGASKAIDQAQADLMNSPFMHPDMLPGLGLSRGMAELLIPTTHGELIFTLSGSAGTGFSRAGKTAFAFTKSPTAKALGKLDARLNAQAFELVTPSPQKSLSFLEAPKMADHHIFPQQFRKFFEQRGINIDDFTITVGETTHLKGLHGKGNAGFPGKWNKRWLTFIEDNPDASAIEIYRFSGRLMDEFKLNGLKIHGYKK